MIFWSKTVILALFEFNPCFFSKGLPKIRLTYVLFIYPMDRSGFCTNFVQNVEPAVTPRCWNLR